MIPGVPQRRPGVTRALAVAATVALLSGCVKTDTTWTSQTALEQIRTRGELRVVTLNLPTSYYLGAQGATRGLEFDLARLFAQQLGVNLVMYPVANEQAMQTELENGRADIAAAQITDSADWDRVGLPAQPYGNIPQLVVYRRDKPRPSGTGQFATAKLAVRAGSFQERQLEVLKTNVPKMHWLETAPYWADPLEDVDTGDADYAITDAREFSFSRHLYPTVMVGFELPQQRPVQWIVRRGASDLLSQVNSFFAALSQSGKLAPMLQQSTGDSRSFVYEESREFEKMQTERLPRFRSWFEQASAESGLDWRLLAAIAYQESKWDARALSEDGAQGVMMLMAETAAQLGVKDRTNAQQNIFAGARYLASVRDRIPERIREPDRTWFTVAAYNAGYGHVEDARVLAASLGKNQDSWADVRGQLPLLQQERWYAKAKHGYARGWEPVQMVDRVQRFLTLLEWQPGEGLASQSTRVNQADNPPPGKDPLEPSKVRTSGATAVSAAPKSAERG